MKGLSLVGDETPAKKRNTGSETFKLIQEKNEADRQLKIEKMALRKQEVELRKEVVNLYREEAPNQIIKFFMFSCIFKFIMLFFQEQLCMQQEEMRRNNQMMMQMQQQQQQMFIAMMNIFNKEQ